MGVVTTSKKWLNNMVSNVKIMMTIDDSDVCPVCGAYWAGDGYCSGGFITEYPKMSGGRHPRSSDGKMSRDEWERGRAKRIAELRKELEMNNFHGSKLFIKQLTDEHRKYVGLVPPSMEVRIGGTPFLSGFERVVIGAHGPYIEFNESQCLIPLVTKEGQEWREESSPKYIWLYPEGFPEIKVYKQVRPVKYASYVVGKMYVDYWSVTPACRSDC